MRQFGPSTLGPKSSLWRGIKGEVNLPLERGKVEFVRFLTRHGPMARRIGQFDPRTLAPKSSLWRGIQGRGASQDGPTRFQDGPQSAQNCHKMDPRGSGSQIVPVEEDKGGGGPAEMAPGGSRMAPRTPNMATKWTQEDPERLQDSPERSQDGPLNPQNGPNRPQDASRSNLVAQF